MSCVGLLIGTLLVLTASGKPLDDLFQKSEQMCIHDIPDIEEIPPPVHIEPKEHVIKRSAEHNLRVAIFYHDSVKSLGSREKEIVEQVIPEGVGFWEKALKIRRNEGTIRLSRGCKDGRYYPIDNKRWCVKECAPRMCGQFQVPEEHLEACRSCEIGGRICSTENEGAGVKNTDFVLYVTVKETDSCSGRTIAHAGHCQQESALDRPIAGITNICPSSLRRQPAELDQLVETVIHELAHALGFSKHLFPFFRDQNGNPLTKRGPDGLPPIDPQSRRRIWSSNTIKKVIRNDWKVRYGTTRRTVNMVVTPRVVEEVRRHFGCPTLEGAELEDQGGSGTSMSHWEKRLFLNEGMTGSSSSNSPFSRITFALMEDSGWYLPDYSMAEELTWGKGKGCDFATKSCKELMDMDRRRDPTASSTKSPFCSTRQSDNDILFCTHDRSAVGLCNLVKYTTDLERMYQHFDTLEGVKQKDVGMYGGNIELADFCPLVREINWRGSSKDTVCSKSNNQPDTNYALEAYGPGSKCFEQGRSWTLRSCYRTPGWINRHGAGCYESECKNGKLSILLQTGDRLACDHVGQIINVTKVESGKLHNGSVQCPSCVDVCGRRNCYASSDYKVGGEKVGLAEELQCGRRFG